MSESQSCKHCGHGVVYYSGEGVDPLCPMCSYGVTEIIVKDFNGNVIEPDTPEKRRARFQAVADRQADAFLAILHSEPPFKFPIKSSQRPR